MKDTVKQLRYERDTLWKCLKRYKKFIKDNDDCLCPDMTTQRKINGAITRGSLYDLCKALNIDQGL